MIANARMYSVSPEVAVHWQQLLSALIVRSGEVVEYLDYPAPAPLEALWQRSDLAAVFMCGLPFARAEPPPRLLAAPVPAGFEYDGQPQYWSELLVRYDSRLTRIEDTFGGRLAFTTPGSQSGCVAALKYFREGAQASERFRNFPLFRELIGPQLTPLGAATAVAAGLADVAPVDSYAYALLCRYRPDLTKQLRSIARTQPTPIPPLVASPEVQSGLDRMLLSAHLVPEWRALLDALLLTRFTAVDATRYASLKVGYQEAARYWREHRLAAKIDPAFAV